MIVRRTLGALAALALAAVATLAPDGTARAQFADQATFAGAGAGSANVQTITLPNASSLGDIVGVLVKYIPGVSNTSAATVTINAFSPCAFRKPTNAGLVALAGGANPEIVAGQSLIFMYDGSFCVILSAVNDSLTVTAANLANSALAFGMPVNLQINATVATNALTISLVGNNGSNASATNPILIPFRDVTIGNGDPQIVSLQSALSFTIASTNTMGCANAVACRLWVVAINNGGTTALCAFNALTRATLSIAALNEGILWTSQSGTSGGSSAGLLYCGTSAVTAKAIRILGYLELTETVAGTWATLPTFIQLMGPGIKKPGDVVQAVVASTTTAGTTASASFAALSSGQSVSIAPSSAANVVDVFTQGSIGVSTSADSFLQIVRGGSTVVGLPIQYSGAQVSPASIHAYDIPATTSSATYSYQGKTNAGTLSYPASSATGAILELKEIMSNLSPANDDASLRMVG